MGFARANNLAFAYARGSYIALLNNDVEVDAMWLTELVKASIENPEVGFCASKMVIWHRREFADSCGDFYSIEGVAGKTGHSYPVEMFNKPRLVFGASAGAAIYRRSMLEDIGLFDEDFFMMHEDSDLSFRAHIMGYKCLYVPTAVAYHHISATIGPNSEAATYYAQRNMEFVYLKNMPLSLLMKYWPLHVLANLMMFASHILRGQASAFARAKLDAARLMPSMLKKRRDIQAARRVSSQEIDNLLVRGWLKDRTRQRIQFHSARFRRNG